MNAVDILLLLIIIATSWAGWRKGFVAGFPALINWAGSLIAGFYTYGYAANFLQQYLPSLGVWMQPVSFVSMVLLYWILFSFILGRLLEGLGAGVHQALWNRLLGVIPGFINGVLFAAIAGALLLLIPNGLTATARDSRLADQLMMNVIWANDKLSPIFDEAISETVAETVEAKPHESVDLNFKITNAKVREDLEAQMLQLVNNERANAGLKPVAADPQLTLVARLHSADMFARGYFSHFTPEHKDPFDRMKEAHVKFLTAGENLAYGRSLLICHQGLMHSPGHRANILHPSFGRLGIGILDGGIYGLMISQEFRN